MTTSKISPRGILNNLLRDGSLENEVAQLKAKSTLVDVLGEAPAYNWSYVAERVVRNATAARHCLEEVALSGGSTSDEFSLIARRFALAWESLATLREGGTNQEVALLNAAAAYDFAGNQANAICLARRVIRETSDPFGEVSGHLISRQFMNVAHTDWENRILSSVEIESVEDALLASATAVATKALRELALFFLSGLHERMHRAEELLTQSESGLLSVGAAEQATLVRTFRALVPVMKERSTWDVLGGVSTSTKWRRYMTLLARGLSSDLMSGTSISELWPSQRTALEGGLLSDDRGKIIKMPTSAGKTRIAEMALVHTLIEHPGAKCIYIAPYRALVSEIESTLIAILGDLGFQVSTALGGFETDEIELFLSRSADVLVTTPEKLDLLNRLTPEYAAQVRLVILDEGHILGDQRRGIKYDLLMTRFKIAAPNVRFIFLSAVVPDTTLEELARWLNTDTDSTLRTEWRPSIQRIAELRWSGLTGTLHYVRESDAPLLSQAFTPGIIRQQEIKFPNPATGRILTRRFPDTTNKAQIAAELALKFVDTGSVLVFCSLPNYTTAVGQAIVDRLQWSSGAGLRDVPSPMDTSNTTSARLAQEWLGEDHKVTQLLRQGVAVHYGALPQAVRNSIEADYRARNFHILVATNTLAQGVNLPIRTVIIHSVWRGVPPDRERISARDYWNIAGRAGRAGEETDGTIIHIVRTPTDRNDFDYYIRRRNSPEPLDSALVRIMQQIVEGRLSNEAFRGAIDPEILAIAAEETSENPISAFIGDVVDGTFAAQQVSRVGLPEDILRNKSLEIANIIAEEVPDIGQRRLFSSTGLSTQSCLYLSEYMTNHAQEVFELIGASGDSIDKAQAISEVVAALNESEVQEAYSGSYLELLRDWMGGVSVPQIRLNLGDDAPNVEQLGRFIENYFGGRLPWVISGFNRIAASALSSEEGALPLTVRTLPAMVKAGVGFPAAAWAAAAGAASRDAAIRIGAQFDLERETSSSEEGTEPSYSEFLEWLRPMTSEELNQSYGLEGAVLQETLNAFQRNTKNPLLNTEIRFPLQFDVRGIFYGSRRQTASQVRPGIELSLERDYDNLVDRNAIMVTFRNRDLGYVPRDYAQLIAPDLDAGLVYRCYAARIELGETPSITARIEA